MKKALFLIAVLLGSTTAFAQNLDKNEAKLMKAFLSEPAKEGTNAQALKVANINDIASIEGVTVQNGHVTAIEWKDKKLGGTLNLAGFKALTKVDVSRNEITSMTVAGCANLTDLNASRNKIAEIDLDNCGNLQNVAVYKNRLTEIDLNNTPMLYIKHISE
ncbi:MAG: hypothetical protein K2L26_01200, partial [Duncaniella sp.]|nr:hypothetical protein [Duncaniella sp.]